MFYSRDESGELVLLLGKERSEKGFRDSGLWANFGGKKEPTDRSNLWGAVREGWEESGGFLGSKKEIYKKIKDSGQVAYEQNGAAIYFCPVEYDPNLPALYANVQHYISQSTVQPLDRIKKEGFYEKSAIEWTDLQYILEHPQEHRRCFMRSLLEMIDQGIFSCL